MVLTSDIAPPQSAPATRDLSDVLDSDESLERAQKALYHSLQLLSSAGGDDRKIRDILESIRSTNQQGSRRIVMVEPMTQRAQFLRKRTGLSSRPATRCALIERLAAKAA
jgi:hypothetical protein